MSPLRFAPFSTLICLCSLLFLPVIQADDGSFEIVAQANQQISETLSLEGGLTLSGTTRTINDNGRVVFPSSIVTPESSDGFAIFAWEAGQLQELVRSGMSLLSTGAI